MHVWCCTNLYLVEPIGDVFDKEVAYAMGGALVEVIDREHCLQQIIPLLTEVSLVCSHDELIVFTFHAEAVQNNLKQLFAARRVQIESAHFQII